MVEHRMGREAGYGYHGTVGGPRIAVQRTGEAFVLPAAHDRGAAAGANPDDMG
jgi:hypothetical protein